MAVKVKATVTITRWQGSQHPTKASILRIMKEQNLRPYLWDNTANYRIAVRSHNYDKVLYVLAGSIEVILPDSNQRVKLRVGDRIDIPASVRHGMNLGHTGAECVEAASRDARRQL
jgi:quercetin dioxygenase-like cupin family protein